ncbi:MAG: alpha-2-macroglobulin family protein [Vulcanimicrobiota bacterium]
MLRKLPRLAGAVLLLASLLACIGPGAPPSDFDPNRVQSFKMVLSQGPSQAPSPLARPAVVPLEAQAVESLVPVLPEPPTRPFARREIAPPKSPKVQPAFASQPTEVPAPQPGPLEVVRVAPQGAVGRLPHLSVTFSQSMVALGADDSRPVQLSPEPPGQWRWVGTRTLLFEPEGGFPMATDYTIEVPAGLTSTAGGRLTQPGRWTFSTPAPTVIGSSPQGVGVELQPLIFLHFDQRIRAADVLSHLELRVGNATYPLELASAAERAEDGEILDLIDAAEPDTWVVVRPPQPLPRAAEATVSLAAGTPSAEGPKTSEKAWEFRFHTYSPLRCVRHSARPIRPDESLWLKFNNQLDRASFVDEMVQVEPAIPELEVRVEGDTIRLDGPTQGSTTYTVTVHPKLTDVFGQRLGKPESYPFRVGRAEPELSALDNTWLDPTRPVYAYQSVNIGQVRVRLHRVGPQDRQAFEKYARAREWKDAISGPLPGSALVDETVKLSDGRHEMKLPPGYGQYLVAVEQTGKHGWRGRMLAWVQVTDLELDAMRDQDQTVALVSEHASGRGVTGVEVSLLPAGPRTVSSQSGLARLTGTTGVVEARKGDDRCYLFGLESVHRQEGELLWYVVDDRGLYRPGETVCLTGWVREPGSLAGKPGRLKFACKAGDELIAEGLVEVRPSGGFEFSFRLPDKPVSLGGGEVELEFDGQTHQHYLSIHEFRRPEFEVDARPGPGPYFIGDQGRMQVEAHYYTGAALPNAEVSWQVKATPSPFEPPGHPDFSFGLVRDTVGYFDSERSGWPTSYQRLKGRTDGFGKHVLLMDFQSVWPPQPTLVSAEAMVTDLNRKDWAVGTSLLVHPAELYVGLRQLGETPRFEVLVTDLEGKPVAGAPVEVRLDEEHQRVVSDLEPVVVEFASRRAHRVNALVYDQKKRPNLTSLPVWLSTTSADGEMRLQADKAEYSPGEVAEVTVDAPFAPTSGLWWTNLDQVEPMTFQGRRATLKVRVPEGRPSFSVEVLALGPKGRALKDRLSLDVSLEQQRLEVEVAPSQAEVEPGAETHVEVRVSGAEAAGCEVALWVVDESVLALAEYELADPLQTFFPGTYRATSEDHSRSVAPPRQFEYNDIYGFDLTGHVAGWVGPNPEVRISSEMNAGAEFSFFTTPRAATPRVRQNFDPLAYFAGNLVADSQGRVTTAVKLPDNLTRYRILAVAAGRSQFGTATSSLTARLPLMVRQSPPRFLNLGDRCQLPIVLHNQTDDALETEVAMRAANAHLVERGYRVTVPANDRVEVLFEVEPEQAGIARFQAAARAGSVVDATRFELPVWTPAASQQLATYGHLDQGVTALAIEPPRDAYPGFGGLEVTTSSTAVGSLDDAVSYLENYPYHCAEQVASRLLGRLAVGRKPALLKADLERLTTAQRHDGGWSFWPDADSSQPFVSVHAFHALVRARAAGLTVDDWSWNRGLDYLANLSKSTPGYTGRGRIDVRAYALYVRHLAGQKPSTSELVQQAGGLDQLSSEALGWLLPVLPAAQRRAARQALLNRLDETAAGTGVEQTLGSPDRTQAVVLEALIGDQPQSDLIPKLVSRLEEHRRRGHWQTTQENAWAALALNRYFKTYEKTEPDLVSRLWLGRRYLGQQTFRGRSSEPQQLSLPLEELTRADLVVSRQGKGRLYYRVGLRYAPRDLQQAAVDHGFAVERTYEPIEDNRDVVRQTDGSWRIRAGARVKVRLTMAVDGRRSQVALVDWLPAGLEAINPALAGTTSSQEVSWWGWWDHQNLRDERVEAFAATLAEGVYEYSYEALASTPGQFTAPSACAEEMYHPETFGRSPSLRVTVE